MHKHLFPPSSGAVPEQKTYYFLPHQSLLSREKWSIKLYLSTWLATDYLFALLHRAILLKAKGGIKINEHFLPGTLYSDKKQLCLQVKIMRGSNLYLKQFEIEKKTTAV